jgi:DNA-binding NarL/FixJ family response regulator
MPLQILIADDDRHLRHLVKDYLEMQGYSIIVANNGEEALSFAEKYHPHLLVSDIKMPKKDGYNLVKELRQQPIFRLLPVIFLSQRNTKEARIHGYEVGCDLYLPKPFQMDELGAIVRYLLERSQIFQSELRFFKQKNPDKIHELDQSSSLDLSDLTTREKEVLDLLTQGFSNLKIAQKLNLSPKTIEKYVSSLLKKSETHNRTELVRFALDHNLVV